MRKADNDNEELSFITIGLAVRNVMSYLGQKQNPDQERERPEPEKEVGDPEGRRDYVERRLKEIAAFERRFTSNKKRVR